MTRIGALAFTLMHLLLRCAEAQTLTHRGFVELRGFLFPEDAPNDPRNVVVDLLAREEAFVKPAPWIQFAGGLDVRASSHAQVRKSWRLDVADREILRPALAMRRLSATLTRGPLTLDLGKQFIRWGKADIVTPTDRFAPRDFLNVIDNEFLAVRGARAMLQFRSDAIDVAWVPFFTPSRTPLLYQRWATGSSELPLVGRISARPIPRGHQTGLRWSRSRPGYEYSISVYNGFNHLPNFEAAPRLPATGTPVTVVVAPTTFPISVDVVMRYPSLRMYGADTAVPLRWFTLKGEAAYFTSSTPATDEYVLYVIQLERQTGEWLLVGGYAGEAVTERRGAMTFAPDRGIAKSILGRASYTVDPNRSVAVESAVRQNGDGMYAKGEYSEARGQHVRGTITAALIRGEPDDFLGQYRRNSHVMVALRYSF